MLTFVHINKDTLREVTGLATPMVISQGAFALMIFTDRFFMSLINPTHMAASLGGGVASFFSLSLFIGVLSYGNALVGQYYGARQWDKCSRVVTQSLILSLACLPLLALIAYAVGHLFAAMGHDPAQVVLEKRYFFILMWGALFSLTKSALASYFSGIGSTKIVMIADVLGVIFNIPLSYLLVFGGMGLPALGIGGAALGTVISTWFTVLVFGGFYFAREHREHFRVMASFVLDIGIIRRYLRLGFPSGLELFLNIAAFNLFLLMFQSYGVAEGASAAIVFNWDMLSFVPMLGLNIAIIGLIGRSVGAGDMSKVNEIISAGFLLGLGYSGALAVLFIFFRESLVELFITPGVDYQSIRDLSSYMMVGLSCYVMADALILVSGGVLRGAGDTKWIMNASVALHWAMLLAQFVVIKILHMNAHTSWIIFVCLIFSIAVVYVIRLNSEKWRHPDVLKQVMAEH